MPTFAGSAVLTRFAEIARESQVGCAWTFRAARPATCGAAMEVPDITITSLPVPTAADAMETPGAVTPGFSPESPVRGPPELNDAKLV